MLNLTSRRCNIGISISISTNQIRELGSSQFLWDTAKIITYFLFCSHHSGSSSSTTHSARGGFQWWPHSHGHRPAASPISDLRDGGRGVQEKIQEANWQYRLLLQFQGKNQKRPTTGSAPLDQKEIRVEPLRKSKMSHSSRDATPTATSQNLEPYLQQRL